MWGAGQDPAGHTGVVAGVNAPHGFGTITLYDENGILSGGKSTGVSTIYVNNWQMSVPWNPPYAYNQFNWTVQGSPPAVATPPIVIVANRTGSSIMLSWTEPPPGVATSYAIVRNGVQIGSTTSMGFTDATLGAGSRSYQVIAMNGAYSATSTPVVSNTTAPFGLRADVTGTGKKDDLIYVFPGGASGSTNDLVTFLSNGNGTYREVDQQIRAGDFARGSWFTADVTGNGKDDLVYEFP